MPFARIPIRHNFGIYSHSYLDTLERRLQESHYYESDRSTSRSAKSVEKAEHDIERFVGEYNSCKTEERREKMDIDAQKLLLRIRGQCGLKSGRNEPVNDEGNTNISAAWITLSQLMLCRGHLLTDCTDILLESLDTALLSENHTIILFFILETILFVVQREVDQLQANISLLWRLLSVSHLVALRLHCHHILGDLSNRYLDQKNSLERLLQGTKEILVELCCDNPVLQSITCLVLKIAEDVIRSDKEESTTEGMSDSEHMTVRRCRRFITTSLLRHSLDTWSHITGRCELISYGDRVRREQSSLAVSAFDSSLSSNWIDDYCALGILSRVATISLDAVTKLQSLALSGLCAELSSKQSRAVIGWPDELGVLYANLLADVVIQGSTSAIRRHALIGYETVEDYIGGSCSQSLTIDHKGASHLVGLTLFKTKSQGKTCQHQHDDREDRWRIRFAAVRALIKVYQYYSKVDGETSSINSGITSAAFHIIEHAKSVEHDRRVLPAFKLDSISIKPLQHLFKNIAEVMNSKSPDILNGTFGISRDQSHQSLRYNSGTTTQISNYRSPRSSCDGATTQCYKKPKKTICSDQSVALPVRRQKSSQENIYAAPVAYNERKRSQLLALVQDQFHKELQRKSATCRKEELRDVHQCSYLQTL